MTLSNLSSDLEGEPSPSLTPLTRVLVLSSCTSQKVSAPKRQLTIEDFAKGGRHLKKRERELKSFELSARDMYQGQQHARLMRGIEAINQAKKLKVDLQILSAGYGLISANKVIVPYECTLSTMKKK